MFRSDRSFVLDDSALERGTAFLRERDDGVLLETNVAASPASCGSSPTVRGVLELAVMSPVSSGTA